MDTGFCPKMHRIMIFVRNNMLLFLPWQIAKLINISQNFIYIWMTALMRQMSLSWNALNYNRLWSCRLISKWAAILGLLNRGTPEGTQVHWGSLRGERSDPCAWTQYTLGCLTAPRKAERSLMATLGWQVLYNNLIWGKTDVVISVRWQKLKLWILDSYSKGNDGL